ncbi:Helix-turn-helix domain [Kytococcus sedentarius]|nr:Helix-turn-helix domain [Kytococcus sedentarius]
MAVTLSVAPGDGYSFEMDRKSIVIRLDSSDVASARFTTSPAHELVRIVRALVAPARFPAHRALLRDVRAAAPTTSLATLTQVITARGYVPDFLTPMTEDPAVVAELIRATPAEEITAQLGELVQDGRADPTTVSRLADDPDGTAAALAEAVDALWQEAIEPLWPAMRQVLLADIHARAASVASAGFGAMINGLHPTLMWTGQAIVRTSSRYADDTGPGRALILVPTIFGWPNVQTSTDPARPPTVLYPARNATSDWASPPTQALDRLVGRTRARALAHLDFPAATSDVAHALGIALSTAHHHLDVLASAGLVDRHREGTTVWHLRTPLGDRLVRAPR